MKFLLLIFLIITNVFAFGQTDSLNYEVLKVVCSALNNGKLPKDLINNVDSLLAAMKKEEYNSESSRHYPPTIAVEATVENNLTPLENIKSGRMEFWIWSQVHFFEMDLYWITPSKIKMRSDKISFKFETHTWFSKDIKYYKGKIKANRINDHWVIKAAKLIETKNTFNPWLNLRNGSSVK